MNEELLMHIISYSGTARSLCHEALTSFQEGAFETGEEKYQQAKKELLNAKKKHGELLQHFASAEAIETNLLMVHAEDHLTSTNTIFELISSFKYLFQAVKSQEN
ncbi:MAG: PTS lactose/cellobiose transporter subunit IIA [Enterococcus avium]